MKRLALCLLLLGMAAAPLSFGQESGRPDRVERAEERIEREEAKLALWKWANFLLLAGAIVYMAVKQGGPFFAARSKQIRKEMLESAEVRKEAEDRAAVVDRKLANLAADIASLKADSQKERQAESERLRLHREAERAKIQAHAQREIESAGKAARLDLKRYAAVLAVQLAEQKIRARMAGDVQDRLVGDFVSDLASSESPIRSNH